jgi:hypothetical protein
MVVLLSETLSSGYIVFMGGRVKDRTSDSLPFGKARFPLSEMICTQSAGAKPACRRIRFGLRAIRTSANRL